MERTQETPREFLLDCARFYRSLGFFAKQASLTDEQLADELERIRREDWERHLDPSQIMDQMVLASWDKDRVWWEDAYEWLGDVDTMYTDALQGWARISRGAFRPVDIVETWEGDEGPITVEFTMDGSRYRFNPEFEGETLDTNLLGPINGLTASSGFHFVAMDTTDQTTYLVVLAPAEKTSLSDRGWPIEDWIPVGPPPSTAPPRGVSSTPPKKSWFSRK